MSHQTSQKCPTERPRSNLRQELRLAVAVVADAYIPLALQIPSRPRGRPECDAGVKGQSARSSARSRAQWGNGSHATGPRVVVIESELTPSIESTLLQPADSDRIAGSQPARPRAIRDDVPPDGQKPRSTGTDTFVSLSRARDRDTYPGSAAIPG